MEMWLTIAAVVAVAGMGWDLALRFGSDRMPADDERADAFHSVCREEPSV